MSKILRIRLPSGETHRLTLPAGATLPDLGAMIDNLHLLDGQFSLYADITFTRPFDVSTAAQGDFVFVKGAVIAKPAPPSNSKSPATSTTTTPPANPNPTQPTSASNPQSDKDDEWHPRCRHGPRGMCEHCMPKEDKRERYQKELAKWKGRGMSVSVMEALESLKFKITPQEEAYASAAAVDNDAANEFQSYLAKTAFSQQRAGILYGDVDEESKETKVYAIYEPPQRGSDERYALVEGEEAGDMSQRADALAGMLALKKVGIVFSARPRKCILSGLDLVFAARILSTLKEEDRKSFVVLVVSTAETGETLFEAYQISNLAVEMYEAGIFEDEDKQKPNGGRVTCKEDVLVEGKDTKKVHTEFFLLNIPIKSCESWLRTSFAVENRDIAPQGPSDVKKAVADQSIPYYKRLSDFHALLFLSNIFDMNSDMPGLAAAVKAQSEDIGEGYRLIIEGMASS